MKRILLLFTFACFIMASMSAPKATGVIGIKTQWKQTKSIVWTDDGPQVFDCTDSNDYIEYDMDRRKSLHYFVEDTHNVGIGGDLFFEYVETKDNWDCYYREDSHYGVISKIWIYISSDGQQMHRIMRNLIVIEDFYKRVR